MNRGAIVPRPRLQVTEPVGEFFSHPSHVRSVASGIAVSQGGPARWRSRFANSAGAQRESGTTPPACYSAQICGTKRKQSAFLYANLLKVGQKDILKVCFRADIVIDLRTKHDIASCRWVFLGRTLPVGGVPVTGLGQQA
jgi:hypothetical protein